MTLGKLSITLVVGTTHGASAQSTLVLGKALQV